MKTAKQLLIEAKEIIGTPEKWCKGEYENDAGACCAYGAIRKVVLGSAIKADKPIPVLPDEEERAFRRASGALREALGGASTIYFNDDLSTTHADIMALYDRAIAVCDA